MTSFVTIVSPKIVEWLLLFISNYNANEKEDKKEKKLAKQKEQIYTGGRNGYGAKLCNIFSKEFVVETSSRDSKQSFKQIWTENMSKCEKPIITDAKDDDFTCVTFQPDLTKFKMNELEDDIVALFARRAVDIAACLAGVNVYLNDKRLLSSKFEDYCKLYRRRLSNIDQPWEIAVAPSNIGYQQVSFVNNIATTKGGRHVDYIINQLVNHISECVYDRNKDEKRIDSLQIKSFMWVFVNCCIENPTFDSQTKENMTLPVKSFGSQHKLSNAFLKKIAICGTVENILKFMKESADIEKSVAKPQHFTDIKTNNTGNSVTHYIKKDIDCSTPCVVDGFKPEQRKVIFSCFKLNLHKRITVAQLANSVCELSAYQHGELALTSTIINLAQNFVGSNNINLLEPIGHFGTRLSGGKANGSAHRIFTELSIFARLLFNRNDVSSLTYLIENGRKVEPEWYCPIISTVLVNDVEHDGTGWSKRVPNYNPREIIKNLKRMINNDEPLPMKPYFKNFRGSIDLINETSVLTSGEIAIIGDYKIEITELPIGTWPQPEAMHHAPCTMTQHMLINQTPTPDPTSSITTTLYGKPLEQVTNYKYLGVILNHELDCSKQWDKTSKTTNAHIYLIKQLKRMGFQEEILMNVYQSITLSQYMYTAPLLTSATITIKNEMAKQQLRFLNIIGITPERAYEEYKIPPMEAYIDSQCVNIVQRILKNPHHPITKKHTTITHYNTRNKHPCITTRARTTQYENSCVQKALRMMRDKETNKYTEPKRKEATTIEYQIAVQKSKIKINNNKTKTTKTTKRLQQPITINNKQAQQQQSNTTCNICYKTFKLQSGLKRHNTTTHKNNNNNNNNNIT